LSSGGCNSQCTAKAPEYIMLASIDRTCLQASQPSWAQQRLKQSAVSHTKHWKHVANWRVKVAETDPLKIERRRQSQCRRRLRTWTDGQCSERSAAVEQRFLTGAERGLHVARQSTLVVEWCRQLATSPEQRLLVAVQFYTDSTYLRRAEDWKLYKFAEFRETVNFSVCRDLSWVFAFAAFCGKMHKFLMLKAANWTSNSRLVTKVLSVTHILCMRHDFTPRNEYF